MLDALIAEAVKTRAATEAEIIATLIDGYPDGAGKDVYIKLYEGIYGRKLTEQAAEAWVEKAGRRWTEAETYALGNKLGVNWSKISRWEWYAVMNMMYSVYNGIGDRIEVDEDFYARLAECFIRDEDAPEDKVYRYWREFVL